MWILCISGRRCLHSWLKLFATILILGVGVLIALQMLERLENPTNQFPTYEAMQASGLMQAGWIPKSLPRSASQISETHNLDTNVVKIAFQYAPGDFGTVAQQCASILAEDTQIVFQCRDGTYSFTTNGRGFYTNEPGNLEDSLLD